MSEVYRKRGTSIRFENGTIIRVRESGEAIEDGTLFRCAPIAGSNTPHVDGTAVTQAVRHLRDAAGGLEVERLILTDGRVEHECDGRSWSEDHRRLHVSLVRDRHRLLVDEAGFDPADFADLALHMTRIGPERAAPVRVRLAPRVTAALIRPLMATLPPNVEVEQRVGNIDGKGHPVAEARGAPWPNWYRPSYRVRPVKLPIDVVLRCSVTEVEQDLPVAVALLAPPAGLVLRALVVENHAVYPATLRIVRIDAVSNVVRWFPYGAGVWAGEAEVVT